MNRFILALFLSLAALVAGVRAADAPAAPLPLTRAAFTTVLAGSLSTHFNLDGELQLELLRPWTTPEQLARVWSVEIVEYPMVLASAMLARGRVLADGQPAGDFLVSLRASYWRDAWAARQPVEVNSAFDPAQLEVRRVDFLREREALPASAGDSSLVFVRAIQPNRLLNWRDVARRPLVHKGELVDVSAVDGQLQISMKGLAMESGAQGDTVTVRNPESHKDFSAQVVAQNRVQVRF